MKTFLSLKNAPPIFLVFLPLFLISCSEVGLLSEKNSWIVENINSVGDFLGVYFIMQISILLLGLFLGVFLGRAGGFISLVAHFIWIVSERDYGFFKVFLLFALFSIISFIVNLLFSGMKSNRNEY